MAKKEFTYRGKTLEEIGKMSLAEFAELVPARARRTIKRGFKAQEKILLDKIKAHEKDIQTHCRDMIILPEMVGLTIKIHNGKEFMPITILPEMLGSYLGEYAQTRKKVEHSAPGIGATKSSAALSVK
jgi:small subunit ribosomal protein S19